ncbi:import inner membrane translocase subunit tim-50 [Amanita rubescens]|nr:import inner membrane translocase subunit tim-50 [Amanita rubescens]
MFAVLTRPIQRRAVYHATRCLSQSAPPPPPPPSSTNNNKTSDEQGSERASQQPSPDSSENALKINTSELPNLDFVPAEIKEEPKSTGAKSAKDTLTTGEKQRRHVLRLTWAALLLGLGASTVYMGREWDKDELESKRMKIEDAPSTRWGRTAKRFSDYFGFFSEPIWEELLPPPYPPPHQKPYTLVVSLDDLLVTSTWDRQHGWRTAKRPGVDYFIAYISQFYEVVIFTTQHSYTAMPILEKLDRFGLFVSHRLFREHTRSINGLPVKDLSYLNRDLSKVVCLDTDPEHYSTHPENAVIIPKWKGDPKDSGLVAMIPFLESLAIYKPPDFRPILTSYQGKDIPIEYGKKEAEAKAKHIEEWKKGRKGASTSALTHLLGSQTVSAQTDGPPPSYLEQKRKEAQMNYIQEQKYFEEHKADLEAFIKQQEEAAASQAPSNLWAAIDMFNKKDPDQVAAAGQEVPVTAPSVQPQPQGQQPPKSPT